MQRFILLLLVLSTYSCGTFGQSSNSSQRPLTPDDLSRLEELARPFAFTMAISPDGETVAFGLTRAAFSSEHFGFQLGDLNRQDVWIARASDGRAQNITKGETDDAGFWGPKWSPDGRYLAMLSTRGGNIRVWVWNKQSGILEMLSKRGSPWINLEWVSNDEVALSALPEGAKPALFETDHGVARLTSENWTKAWKGREPTANVLESGIELSTEGRTQEQLLFVNVVTKKQHIVATGLQFQDLRLSPDRRFLAFQRQVGVWRPDPNQIPETHYVHELYELDTVRIGEGNVAQAMAGVSDVFSGRVGWSEDSSQLAVIGYSALKHTTEDAQVFRCVVKQATCRTASRKLSVTGPYRANRVGSRGVVGRGFLWYGENNILIYGSLQSATPEPTQQPMKWWAVDVEGNPREFFDGPIGAPTQFLAQSTGGGLVGVIRGDVWTIDGNGQLTRNLTAKSGEKISSIVWPESWATSIQAAGRELVVGVQRKSTVELYALDLASGAMSPMEKPSADAELAAYDPKARLSVLAAINRTGSYLWLKKLRQEASLVLEMNAFLRDVYEGDLQRIEYRGLDGQTLNGWIILPFDYRAGKTYPVVAYVYSGISYGDTPPVLFPSTHINDTAFLNLQLLASHGYVVLLPSMPAPPLGEEQDTYLELTKGVLPAVDKLIESGIADPKRVGVMGHSYGGFSTYGLITQTNRFGAAVSLAGPCDWLSIYGTFELRNRYTPFVHEDLFRIVQTEANMGNPPWKDSSRYFRNSPINFVDRVRTPLMIIQGDLDYVGIQQGEEFFTALYRQNKRARFVRYWGEDHVFESPANIRDMWQQIYTWLDEFLMKPEDKKPSKGDKSER